MNADGYQSSTPLLFRAHPVFINFAEEFRAVFVRLLAYACGVAAMALIASDVFSGVASNMVEAAIPLRSRDAWSAAVRPQPAFAAPVADFSSQSESYEILRHPEGGRKDILRWSAALAEAPLSQIELYRPGAELMAFGPVASEIAARIADGRTDAMQAGGVIETKFGPVALVSFASHVSGKPQPCIGFAHTFETPRLQISGWSCQGDNAQTQRQAVACALDRLTMLSAGNDPKMAELFARAELKRAGCSNSSQSDWVTATGEPQLRGSFASKKP
jgi:hypothetical protein